MKTLWVFPTLLAMAFGSAVLLTAADTPAVTYMDHDKMAEALAKGGPVASSSDYTVSGAHRGGPGQVEVHDKETDVIYITDGEATFVTGGKMLGGKMTKAGQWLGTDIEGGESRHLSKGDVVVIPAGTPHWFKEVKSVNYLVVKVIKP
ncbi:MAG TPA: cupin domain-containing protein [Bryobacteraceae bacterium]|nr:cupin domain-containing protein [Candidatus Sulfotelmatobacter sp.]HXP83833.1 cupin domain-containing protein [Bryobacteraceae bacterium]